MAFQIMFRKPVGAWQKLALGGIVLTGLAVGHMPMPSRSLYLQSIRLN